MAIDVSITSRQQLAACLQSTLVRPDVTHTQMIRHIESCGEYQYHAAMIPMVYIQDAKTILRGSGVKVATTICFGMGNETVPAKIALLRECARLGADEVDYQPNMGLFISGDLAAFRDESRALVQAAEGMTLKVMLELGFIAAEAEQRRAAQLLEEAGVPWVKNASGGGPRPSVATPEQIRLLRQTLSPQVHVKASGGIKSYEQALALLTAGAELLGTSAAHAIMNGYDQVETDY